MKISDSHLEWKNYADQTIRSGSDASSSTGYQGSVSSQLEAEFSSILDKIAAKVAADSDYLPESKELVTATQAHGARLQLQSRKQSTKEAINSRDTASKKSEAAEKAPVAPKSEQGESRQPIETCEDGKEFEQLESSSGSVCSQDVEGEVSRAEDLSQVEEVEVPEEASTLELEEIASQDLVEAVEAAVVAAGTTTEVVAAESVAPVQVITEGITSENKEVNQDLADNLEQMTQVDGEKVSPELNPITTHMAAESDLSEASPVEPKQVTTTSVVATSVTEGGYESDWTSEFLQALRNRIDQTSDSRLSVEDLNLEVIPAAQIKSAIEQLQSQLNQGEFPSETVIKMLAVLQTLEQVQVRGETAVTPVASQNQSLVEIGGAKGHQADQGTARGEGANQTKALPKHTMTRTMEKVEEVLKEAARSRDGRTISVRLDPPSLGHVKIDVSLREGALHARVIAESPQVAALLRERSAELQALLRRLDLQVQHVSVAVHSEDARNQDLGQSGSQTGGRGDGWRQGSREGDPFGVPNAASGQPIELVKEGLQDHWIA